MKGSKIAGLILCVLVDVACESSIHPTYLVSEGFEGPVLLARSEHVWAPSEGKIIGESGVVLQQGAPADRMNLTVIREQSGSTVDRVGMRGFNGGAQGCRVTAVGFYVGSADRTTAVAQVDALYERTVVDICGRRH